MTDNDIKQALECCVSTDDCKKCPLGGTHQCYPTLEKNALDLVYRQQAEIERLKSLCTSNDVIIKAQEAEIERLNGNLFTISNACMQRRNEAIKEFAEKLKEMAEHGWIISGVQDYAVSLDNIDNLVQKMVGGENEKSN